MNHHTFRLLGLTLALTATTLASAKSSRQKVAQPIQVTFDAVVATPSEILAPVPEVQPQHLVDGLQLVDEINATHALGIFADDEGVEVNNYGGSWNSNSNPSFIRFFDEDKGILPANNTVCAPLVTHLMLHSYGWDWGDYPFLDPKDGFVLDTSASPNPWQYLELIEQGVGFDSKITDARDAAPGDIISIHYSGTTSGHTVILVDLHLDEPMPYPANGNNLNPALAGTTYYRMTVLDSTSSPHSNDTRRFTLTDDNDNEVNYVITGAGTGDMGLFLDANGEVVGHTWSLPNSDYNTQQSGWINGINSRLKLQGDRHLVIGRLPANP